MSVEVTFHGASGVVTGSCFEVSNGAARILIDCGLFQGTKTVRSFNYGSFPFKPKTIDAVLLTHAHIDHCGLVPKLIAYGYNGPIFATAATIDLLSYVLPDSGHIQEMEVERLNWRNQRRGKPLVQPIYTRQDAEDSLDTMQVADYDVWTDVAPGMRARFWDAGHILGSASIELAVESDGETLTLLFSGDIGPGDLVLHGDPTGPVSPDAVIMETTYGDRIRPPSTPEGRRAVLCDAVQRGLKGRGMVLIPCFAVERTQQLLVDLDHLFDTGALPEVPVYVDSPLASRATEVFDRHLEDLDDGTADHPFRRKNLRFVATVEESKSLARITGGAIIMAGSGMAEAGRIRHHLKNYLHRKEAMVLLVGYQAPGTLGRLLDEGRDMVRIQGEEIAVRCHVQRIEEYSGHADQTALLDWLKARKAADKQIMLVHGEEESRLAFTRLVESEIKPSLPLRLPSLGQTYRFSKDKAAEMVGHRPPDLVIADTRADWHNMYADIVLSLRHVLEAAETDSDRRRLLEAVRDTLDGEADKTERRR